MRIQDIFEIAYSVKLAGLSNENQLVRTFFLRSGRRLPFSNIMELYNEIVKVVKSYGYSDVFDFLKDYFPNENFEKIRVYKKNINIKLNLSNSLQSSPVESIISSPLPKAFETTAEEPKVTPTQTEKNETVSKEMSVKPIKIFKDALKEYKNKEKSLNTSLHTNENTVLQSKESPKINESTTDTQIERNSSKDFNSNNVSKKISEKGENAHDHEITSKDKVRINKYKKLSKKFREMDTREKEIDNKFDYFLHRSKTEQNPKISVDNRSLLDENPFTSKFYDDLDLEFKTVMYRIYKLNKNKIKDKSNFNEEMDFLEKYFSKKFQIARKEDDSVKKLSNATAYLMRKLQNKIFESEDPLTIELMLYFKTKLYLFYNYYRK